ncbi:MAG TPA: nucleotidyltransferase domain-containing protein [Polyangiaceae bacterium]|nr:nucleotidyltransferase domain-containing protein [Polyangiaceae bacterium]
MTPPEIEAILERELLRRVPGLSAAYLFGSFGRGEARPDSDVDLALLYARPPASTLRDQPFLLAAELESLFGRSVDVIVLNTAPADLVHRILRDGRLIVQTNPSARIAFEVRARNEYFDLLPLLRRYRRAPDVA